MKKLTEEQIQNCIKDWSLIGSYNISYLAHSIQKRLELLNPPTETSEWKKVSEGVTWPCYVWFELTGIGFSKERDHSPTGISSMAANRPTHFMPITLPEPPAPEQSLCEKAFLKLHPSGSLTGFDIKIFREGYEAAQSKAKGEQ